MSQLSTYIPSSCFQCHSLILTSQHHGEYGEEFLEVGVRRYVTKPYTGETCKGKVQGRDVLGFDTWSTRGHILYVWFVDLDCQRVQPTCGNQRHTYGISTCTFRVII